MQIYTLNSIPPNHFQTFQTFSTQNAHRQHLYTTADYNTTMRQTQPQTNRNMPKRMPATHTRTSKPIR